MAACFAAGQGVHSFCRERVLVASARVGVDRGGACKLTFDLIHRETRMRRAVKIARPELRMRWMIEQQRYRAIPGSHFEQLDFIVGRIAELRPCEVSIAVAEEKIDRTLFVANGLFDRSEN